MVFLDYQALWFKSFSSFKDKGHIGFTITCRKFLKFFIILDDFLYGEYLIFSTDRYYLESITDTDLIVHKDRTIIHIFSDKSIITRIIAV